MLAACMMTSVLPVNALALGGAPKNGVTAQEDTATTIPTTGTTITEGGDYEIPKGTYTGKIVIDVTDTTQPVNIAIKGKVTAQCDPFFNIIKTGIVNIENEGNYEVDCATRTSHFMYINYSGAQVTVTNGQYKGSGGIHLIMNFSGSLTLNNITAQTESSYAITSAGTVIINGGTYTRSGPISSSIENGAIGNGGGTVASTNPDAVVIDCAGDHGDTQINRGTIKGGKDGIRLENLGSSEVTLKQATFESNASNVHLGAGQKIDIKRNFTGTATILTDDPSVGRQITLKNENEDLSYQNKLNLVSMDPGYIIGYKRGDDGVEYRYLAKADGSIVTADGEELQRHR